MDNLKIEKLKFRKLKKRKGENEQMLKLRKEKPRNRIAAKKKWKIEILIYNGYS